MVGRRFWVVGCLALTRTAVAQTTHVENRCERLDAEQYEELDARVQLLLRAGNDGRPLPAVVCTDQAIWVEWGGERYPLPGRAPIVDEAVEVIEAELGRKPEVGATPDEPGNARPSPLEPGGAAPPPPPAAGRPADRAALRPADARGGGIALGMESELASDTIGVTSGPAFDFAALIGPISIGGRESIRFTLSGRRVSFMDFQALVGYGAPFDPSKRFGVVLRSGPEWMVAYPEGNAGQAAVVPVIDLGLRVAHHWGPVGVWLGVDARFRASRLSLRSRSDLVANDVGGSLTLGAAFVDWSRK